MARIIVSLYGFDFWFGCAGPTINSSVVADDPFEQGCKSLNMKFGNWNTKENFTE